MNKQQINELRIVLMYIKLALEIYDNNHALYKTAMGSEKVKERVMESLRGLPQTAEIKYVLRYFENALKLGHQRYWEMLDKDNVMENVVSRLEKAAQWNGGEEKAFIRATAEQVKNIGGKTPSEKTKNTLTFIGAVMAGLTIGIGGAYLYSNSKKKNANKE